MQSRHHIGDCDDRAAATAIIVRNPALPPAQLVATIGYGHDEPAEDALSSNATLTSSAADMMPSQSTSIHDTRIRIPELVLRHVQTTPDASTAGEHETVTFTIERKMWISCPSDVTRNASGGAGDACVCSICLDEIPKSQCEEAVVTACGHVFHAECCRQSEKIFVRDRANWQCPMCREEITTVRASYNHVLIRGAQNPEAIGDQLRQLMANNGVIAHIVLQLLGHFVTGYHSLQDSSQAALTPAQGAAAATLSGLESTGPVPEGMYASDAEQEAGAAQVATGTRGFPAASAAVSVHSALDSSPYSALNQMEVLSRLPVGRLNTASGTRGIPAAEEAGDAQTTTRAIQADCESGSGARLLRHPRDGWQSGLVSSTVSVRVDLLMAQAHPNTANKGAAEFVRRRIQNRLSWISAVILTTTLLLVCILSGAKFAS